MDAEKPYRFTFLLLDRFTLMPFSAAIEPLRLANRAAGRPLYEWRLVGLAGAGGQVSCSNGTTVSLDAGLDVDPARHETVIVCAGLIGSSRFDSIRAITSARRGWRTPIRVAIDRRWRS